MEKVRRTKCDTTQNGHPGRWAEGGVCKYRTGTTATMNLHLRPTKEGERRRPTTAATPRRTGNGHNRNAIYANRKARIHTLCTAIASGSYGAERVGGNHNARLGVELTLDVNRTRDGGVGLLL